MSHLTRKNPSPYDLYRVAGTLSLTQSINQSHISVAGDVADVDVDIDVDVADATSVHTGDCQFYLLCVILDIFFSQPCLRVLWSRTGVCYACVDMELISGPTFSSPAISSLAFSAPPLYTVHKMAYVR